ncbi:MAG TPA: cytochrome c biogenesis heme-transporting ATPase CcmA [Burkholderiales bacterium]|nr:cytochrome c biogenesis heme-transporting ATPase CcmA [Burkholderiales bacterium]
MNAYLQVSELACLRGERQLFHDLFFDLEAGTLMRIEGANGSGKTSLLRMLGGLTQPAAGRIQWNMVPIDELGERYRESVFLLGHQNALKDELSPIENLELAAALHGIPIQRADAMESLTSLGLSGATVQLPVRLLSQGQKRRAALAALAFRTQAPLWLLDEPFAALDPEAIRAVALRIATQLERGGIVVYTTHQEVALSAPRRASVLLQ